MQTVMDMAELSAFIARNSPRSATISRDRRVDRRQDHHAPEEWPTGIHAPRWHGVGPQHVHALADVADYLAILARIRPVARWR